MAGLDKSGSVEVFAAREGQPVEFTGPSDGTSAPRGSLTNCRPLHARSVTPATDTTVTWENNRTTMQHQTRGEPSWLRRRSPAAGWYQR